MLFSKRELFSKLAQGLELPEGIEQIISLTKENLEKGKVNYEDCAPLIKLKATICLEKPNT
ncbi:MAG: ATP-dependent helicase [Peptococcaceae bacterium]|nr:ATP-dependent helicase [Peptococcaceae bacterium]